MKYFNFESLIKKYETFFIVISTSEGKYNDKGDWQPGTEEKTQMSGAIINLKEDRIYRSQGLLTEKDLQLFMLKPLSDGLIGSTVIYKGNKYRLQETVENGDFTGIWAYLLKYISAFNRGDTSD